MTRLLIFTMGVLFLVIGCNPKEVRKENQTDAIEVTVTPVRTVDYQVPVRCTGRLGTMTEMKLSFKTGGIVDRMNVREGMQVEKGKVLAVLDMSEIKAQAEQARIGFEKAGRDLKRAENLYSDSVVTLEQLQNARSAYELARTQKEIAEFNLVHSKITAPSDGKIQKLLVETNEIIAPGYPAILFASTENDWILRVALVDKDIVRLDIGDSASITMDAFPDIYFDAEVTQLGTLADPVTGTYEAELLIPGALGQFRTGFIARATIYPSKVNRGVVVPIEALVDASDRTAFVYTYRSGNIEKRRIRTGMILGADIVVVQGVMEGDTVVNGGAAYLREDSRVILADPSKSPSQ
jgi:RND family efflux transporter MFP subunit